MSAAHMERTCSHARFRRGFIVFNTINWFSGPGLLGATIWYYITLRTYHPVIHEARFQIPSILLMSAGVGTVIGGIFGCMGSINENKRFIVAFSGFLLLCFAVELYCCIEYFKFYDELPNYIPSRLSYSLDIYSHNTRYQDIINNIQAQMKCCGSVNYTDWGMQSPPASCYFRGALNNTNVSSDQSKVSKIYSQVLI